MRYDVVIRRVGFGLSAMGFIVAASVIVQHGVFAHGGEGGVDAYAYWSAARRVFEDGRIYGDTVGGFAAYLYPPLFAQALAPAATVPFDVFLWSWRLVLLGALRVAAGSWTMTGILLLLFPPVLVEIDAGNVHLLMAAAIARAIRGDSRWVAVAAAVKFVPIFGTPWSIRTDPRGLVRGAGALAIVAMLSVVVSPAAWQDYLGLVRSPVHQPVGDVNLTEQVPWALRLAVAGALGLLGARWAPLVPVAATLAYPVVWFSSLSTMVALAAVLGSQPHPVRFGYASRRPGDHSDAPSGRIVHR